MIYVSYLLFHSGTPGCDEIAVNVPSFQSLKSSLYRTRLQRFPTLPQTREDIDFSGEWTRTASGEEFLLADAGQNDPNRYIVLATAGNLEKLCNADTIYIDGTFKSSPQLFYQLFTVHAVFNDQHFPLVYAFLPNKTTSIYNRFFQKLKESCQDNGLHLNPSVILSDFEGGIIRSVALQFPGVHHQGCFYHFSQAIWRAVQNHGLQVQYSSNDALRLFIRQLMALAFLPEWEISIYYSELKQHKPIALPQLDNLLSYIENTWLDGGQFSPSMWSVFEVDGSRTNNHLEGWHSKFNSIISRPHPNIYQLVDAIKEEQALTELTAVQLEAGSQPPRRKRRYIAVNERLDRLKKAYIDGEKSIDQFIVGVAYNLSTFV